QVVIKSMMKKGKRKHSLVKAALIFLSVFASSRLCLGFPSGVKHTLPILSICSSRTEIHQAP
ncbi:MAG: hypothetical protein ACLFTI_06370, partial [Anaerolineales bacterium]